MGVSDEASAPLDPGWERALEGLEPQFAKVREELVARRSGGEQILPEPHHVLRAFRQPFERVRVLILGQDPYPTPGHPIGLSFAVEESVRPLPKSLNNIFKELESDCGVPRAPTAISLRGLTRGADAQSCPDRGRGKARLSPGHRLGGDHGDGDPGAGRARHPLVAILWGAEARRLQPLLHDGPNTEVIVSRTLAAVRLPRVLRLPAVQQSESGPGSYGCGSSGLAAAVRPPISVGGSASVRSTSAPW